MISLKYEVIVEMPITKSLKYSIVQSPSAITKSLKYVVKVYPYKKKASPYSKLVRTC